MRERGTYLIQSGDTDLYKIGDSNDTSIRKPQLQTGNPEELREVMTLPGGRPLQDFLHEVFKDRHIRGEWFTFPDRLTAMHLMCTWSEVYWKLKAGNPELRADMLADLAVLYA
jgi:hypothetical protein